MPTAEQMFKALREGLTDEELRNIFSAISKLLAAYDQIATTHVVNPALMPKPEPANLEDGLKRAS